MREDLWPYTGSEPRREDGSPSHAGLFVSLLVRYPQIGSVRYLPDDGTLVLGFMVRGKMTSEEFAALRSQVELSLEVFSELSGRPIHVLDLRHIRCSPFTALEVVRDVETLTRMELSVIVGTLTDRLGEDLVWEPAESEDTVYEPLLQDDLIEHLLDDVRLVPPPRRVIGFRDEGRIVVHGEHGKS